MSSHNEFVSLSTLTMDPCDLTDAAYALSRETWLCTGCCTPKPEIDAVDAYLESIPIDKPINIVNGCGLSVVYKPFLDRFPGEFVDRDLCLGRVFTTDGAAVAEWMTYRGRRRLIVRGSEHAGVRKCDDCNRDVYFAMGKKYLYPQPCDEVTIFERSGGGGLILRQDIFDEIDLGEWPKLDVEELPVLEEPTDGLGVLPNA